MTQTEALRLALEALKEDRAWLETDAPTEVWEKNNEAITAIKATLEANEFNPDWDTQAVLVEEIQRMAKRIEELEAQRTWVGLTDAEVDQAFTELTLRKIYQAIEAKLKEKNT
jgi:KaiC/GvpD/RAD55 family RecA-like ATPase